MNEEEQKVWDDFYGTLVGWTYHPGYYRENATKPTLEKCADVADRMIEVRRKRFSKANNEAEHIPVKEDARLADTGDPSWEWNDCQVTFMQNMEHEGYDVEVADNDGIIVKSHVFLHEWSGYVTPFINAKDVTGMVEYLIELNKLERRDGTIIRDE